MANISPQAVSAARQALAVAEEHLPRSVAIIMDGNGRWAVRQGLPRSAGHVEGAKVVRRIVTQAAEWGLEALTLYSFSIENWRRPREEVGVLMNLYAEYLINERPMLVENNIRLRHLGRRDGLPQRVLNELDESLRISASNTGMYLCLALNYGSRVEITDAVRRIAGRVAQGQLAPEQIDEQTISDSLDSANVTDPDLVIRTAGELRLSNFLLWQISYAEFYASEKYWPEFDATEFRRAILAYATRDRRYGGLTRENTQ